MKSSHLNINNVRVGDIRLDPEYHLSDGVRIKRIISSMPYPVASVKDLSTRIFYSGRAKRVYVSKKENGIPLLTGSAILQADLSNLKLASSKYTPNLDEMIVQKGWILISRSGSVGNTAYANGEHANKLGSEDVIRVCPNDKVMRGYLYAYLASKFGHSLLTQGTFGAVIQHIEPDFIGTIPVPQLPGSFQKEVDDLIQESSRLREEASCLLNSAHKIIEDKYDIAAIQKSPIVSISSILNSHTIRFEASYHTSSNRSVYDYIINNTEYKYLKDCTSKIFRPGIFKREYVPNGVTFLGGADILMAIPNSDKKLSFRQVEKMPELRVHKNWILVTCGGTLGNTVLIDNQLEKCAISQHVMRLVPNNVIPQGYLYAFLSSKVGYKLITMFSSGSVIPQIESHHLELVPIPILEADIMSHIDVLITKYVNCIEQSKEKETRAISMVEQEIEKWNN